MFRALTLALLVGVTGVSGVVVGPVSVAEAQDVNYAAMTEDELVAAIVAACSAGGPCQQVIAAISAAVGPTAASAAVTAAQASAPAAASTIQTAAQNAGVGSGGATSGTNVGSTDENPGDNGGDTSVGSGTKGSAS